MKKIGCFKYEQRQWIGTIAVLQFEARTRIVVNERKHIATDPDYLVLKQDNANSFDIELGAGWDRYSVQQRVAYKVISLDDPCLAHPIHTILWEDRHDGFWYLYWDRSSAGNHMAEKLFVQEELKPQLGIIPVTKMTPHMELHYPQLVAG